MNIIMIASVRLLDEIPNFDTGNKMEKLIFYGINNPQIPQIYINKICEI